MLKIFWQISSGGVDLVYYFLVEIKMLFNEKSKCSVETIFLCMLFCFFIEEKYVMEVRLFPQRWV